MARHLCDILAGTRLALPATERDGRFRVATEQVFADHEELFRLLAPLDTFACEALMGLDLSLDSITRPTPGDALALRGEVP